MSATYTTLSDLIEREIAPALFDGTESVEPNFDIDGFAATLRDRDLIVWDESGQGFQLVTDEDGETPGFWELVEEFDAAAAARAIVICEDPRETMMLSSNGPLYGADAIALADDPHISDEDWERLEAIRVAQAAGEDAYFSAFAEKAKAEGLKLGYQVDVLRGQSTDSHIYGRTTSTDGDESGGNSVENRVWQAAHDTTSLPQEWDQ